MELDPFRTSGFLSVEFRTLKTRKVLKSRVDQQYGCGTKEYQHIRDYDHH